MRTEKIVKNDIELQKFLKEKCTPALCYVVSIVFGMVYLYSYKSPSKIPYNDYSLAYNHKYYKNGIWHNFPTKTIIKYENTGMGCE